MRILRILGTMEKVRRKSPWAHFMIKMEIPQLLPGAQAQYPDIAALCYKHIRGEDTGGKNIGIGYDSSANGFGAISIGIALREGDSSDLKYIPRLTVVGRFGDDPNKVFEAQTASLGPDMKDLIRFFVHGDEVNLKAANSHTK